MQVFKNHHSDSGQHLITSWPGSPFSDQIYIHIAATYKYTLASHPAPEHCVPKENLQQQLSAYQAYRQVH